MDIDTCKRSSTVSNERREQERNKKKARKIPKRQKLAAE